MRIPEKIGEFFYAIVIGNVPNECGVLSAECGVRSAECGMRSAEC